MATSRDKLPDAPASTFEIRREANNTLLESVRQKLGPMTNDTEADVGMLRMVCVALHCLLDRVDEIEYLLESKGLIDDEHEFDELVKIFKELQNG